MSKFLAIITLISVLLFKVHVVYSQDSVVLKKIESLDKAQGEEKNILLLKETIKLSKNNTEILNAKIAIAHQLVAVRKVDSCIVFCQQEIAYYHQQKDAFSEANFYKLLGNAYYHYPLKDKALIYWNKCLEISEPNNFNLLNEHCTHNIGAVLLENEDIPQAEKYLKKALKMGLLNAPKLSQTNNNHYRVLASLYNLSERYNEAEIIFLDIINDNKIMKDTFHLIETMMFYTAVLRNKNNNTKALQIGNDALNMSRATKDFELIATALSQHVQNLQATGKYQEACKYFWEMDGMVRQKFNSDLNTKIGAAEAKFHTSEIEFEKKQAIYKAKKEQQLYLISFLSLLAIGGSALYFFNQKRKQKVAQQLQQQRIQSILDGEEKERTRIAKDLHDGIVQDLTAIKMQLNNNLNDEVIDKQKIVRILNDVDKASNEVRNISYQMMPTTLRELGFIPAIEDLLKRVLTPTNIQYDFEQIGTNNRLQEKIEVSLFRITQELLNNVIKHSQASFVSLLINQKSDAVHLIFEDNGHGFDENAITKGIGLNSLSSRVELLHGNIQYEKTNGSGTVAIVKIPL
jgi:signal transduction histidine kinase